MDSTAQQQRRRRQKQCELHFGNKTYKRRDFMTNIRLQSHSHFFVTSYRLNGGANFDINSTILPSKHWMKTIHDVGECASSIPFTLDLRIKGYILHSNGTLKIISIFEWKYKSNILFRYLLKCVLFELNSALPMRMRCKSIHINEDKWNILIEQTHRLSKRVCMEFAWIDCYLLENFFFIHKLVYKIARE